MDKIENENENDSDSGNSANHSDIEQPRLRRRAAVNAGKQIKQIQKELRSDSDSDID